MLTIENILKEFAQEFYISKNSSERPKIEKSLENITKKLRLEFGDRIETIEIFGSYARKTILPRTYDPKSDIDLLIIFDHESINVNPSTYRKHLHDFAEDYYPRSLSFKSKPSVVLELNHISYDLVPAIIQEKGFIFTSEEIYIPKNDTEWMYTDISGFSEKLEKRNKRFNYDVKRIIRLLKAWNAKVDYPISSYRLEQIIADMNFSGDNIESGFFYAIENLPDSWNTNSTEKKVKALKENAESLMEALEDNDIEDARKYLSKILPISKLISIT